MFLRRSVLLGTIPPAIAPNNNALSHQMTAESSPHHGLTVLRWPAVLMLAFLPCTTALAQQPAGPNRPPGVPDGYVITPSGYFHPSCVQQLAEGDTLLSDKLAIQHADGAIEKVKACEYPHYAPGGESAAQACQGITNANWLEAACVTTSTATPYGELTAIWTVPPAPTNSTNCQAFPNTCQTVFFFPGFAHNPATTILQPVLAWNNYRSFPGQWAIASWNCCLSGKNIHSTPVGVNPNDKIKGFIRSTCSAGTATCPTWKVTTTDATFNPPKSTTFPITGNAETFNWAFAGVLEAYNITECDDYPQSGQLTFSGVALYDYNFNRVSPLWSDFINTSFTPQCGYVVRSAATQAMLDYLPTVLLKPYGTVQVATTPPPYNTVLVDGNLCSPTAPVDPICTQGVATDVTVTLDRKVYSQCGCPSPPCLEFERNDIVVISQGQTMGTFSDYAGRDPSCNTLPITTQWTITGAVLAPNNIALNLSIVPPQQLTLSAVF